MAAYTSFKIDSSVNNIPTSFSTAAGSLALPAISGRQQTLVLINESSSRIAVNVSQNSATTAPTSVVDAYIPAAPANGFSSVTLDLPVLSGTVYLKSDTGSAITSGLVYGWVTPQVSP